MAARRTELEECPHCGATFPAGRLACPECGSDAATGWKSAEEIDYQAVEIPDAWPPDAAVGGGWPRLWWIAALLALVGMVAALFVWR